MNSVSTYMDRKVKCESYWTEFTSRRVFVAGSTVLNDPNKREERGGRGGGERREKREREGGRDRARERLRERERHGEKKEGKGGRVKRRSLAGQRKIEKRRT